jgi:hypothetical protein
MVFPAAISVLDKFNIIISHFGMLGESWFGVRQSHVSWLAGVQFINKICGVK